MNLCYDGDKWLMVTLSIVAISLTVGLVLTQYAHGLTEEQYSNMFGEQMMSLEV
jgi:hypothetical protein